MRLFNHLPVRFKLYVMVALGALALGATAWFATTSLYDRMLADRVDKMRTAADLVVTHAGWLEDQVKAGKLKHDEAVARFRDEVRAMRYDGEGGYVYVGTLDGETILHPNPALEGKPGPLDAKGQPIVPMLVAALGLGDHAVLTYTFAKPGGGDPLPKLTYARRFEPWRLVIATGMWTDDIDAEIRSAEIWLLLTGIAMIAMMSAAALLISRNIATPLGVLKVQMQQLASGDLSVEIPDDGRSDEIGWMIRAVQVFREYGITIRKLQAEQETTVANHRAEHQTNMARMAAGFEEHVGGIVADVEQAAGQLRGTAQSMTEIAKSSETKASAVASAADAASLSMQTVASATEELSASIGEISQQVNQSSQIVARAVADARRTDGVVRQLAEGARKIGEVVNLITSIAGQTNLLALNATIEAARAGEAGKGFAVVAAEVKNLATQTGRATEEIGTQINDIQTATQQAVTAIEGIVGVISEADGIAATIAAAVEEQGAATREIARSVQTAAAGTQDVTANIAGVSRAANDAQTAAENVLTAATSLSANAARLGAEARGFVASVRAA
jgi:methyl-accepting chemotaxis protein